MTLRKKECNCSGPSKQEGAQLTSFFTPPTDSQTLPVSLPHSTPDLFFHPERPEWAQSPRPLHVFLSQSRGALTPSPAGLGQSRRAQTPGALRWPQRWRARSEEEGARRQTAPPPATQPRLYDKGPGGGRGGRGDDRGRGGALNAPAQLRWRGGSAGSRRRRRLGGTGPGPRPPPVLPAEALSVPRRGPLAGGPTRTPPPPLPPLGRGRSQREERPRAVGPRGGVPGGREAWEVRDCSALSAREGRKASGTPPLSSSGRRHRLTLFATLPLSFQALKPQSSAAAQVLSPPLPDTTPLLPTDISASDLARVLA